MTTDKIKPSYQCSNPPFLSTDTFAFLTLWRYLSLALNPMGRLHYVNPVRCVATVCHQVRCMYWGHLGHFHRATSLLKWYEIVCMRYLACTFSQMKSINIFSMFFAIWISRTFPLEIYWGLNIEPHCFHVYVCQCWPQTLVAICRNMDIWDVFMLHPPGKMYLGFGAYKDVMLPV